MAVRGFAGPESATGFGVSALPAIDGHPDKQSFRGSRSRASSPQSHGSKEKGSPRVGEVRAACRRAGKSVVTLSRRIRVQRERVTRFKRAVQLVSLNRVEHVLPETDALRGALYLLVVESLLGGCALLVALEAPVVVLGVFAFASQ